MFNNHPKALFENVCYYGFKLKNLLMRMHFNMLPKQHDQEILVNVVNTEKEQDKDTTPGLRFQSYQ